MASVKILQMPAFKRAYKKLHQNQKISVAKAVAAIAKDLLLGEIKKGDLAGIYIHKFRCVNRQFLLAYEFDQASRTLLCLGVHENFYRDLKKNH